LSEPFQKMDAMPSALCTTATCVHASSGKVLEDARLEDEHTPSDDGTASVCFSLRTVPSMSAT